jgi:hypothetical protein
MVATQNWRRRCQANFRTKLVWNKPLGCISQEARKGHNYTTTFPVYDFKRCQDNVNMAFIQNRELNYIVQKDHKLKKVSIE